MFIESLECFQTAIIIYEKLLMYGHISFALGDYILSKLTIFCDQLETEEEADVDPFNEEEHKSEQDNQSEGLNNEELYKEILVSSQNKLSNPDYDKLDTSQNQQFHQHYGLRNCLEFLQ